MVVSAQGMEYTIVNGQVLYEHQKLVTDALAGRVVRSEPVHPSPINAVDSATKAKRDGREAHPA